MCDKLNKKSKNAAVKPFMVKNHLWVFCNAQVVNPAFDSQARAGLGVCGGGPPAQRRGRLAQGG
jgi:hypothetical protein